MLEKLYTELGNLLVQAEILGTAVIPNQGQIGMIKQRIYEQLKRQSVPQPKINKDLPEVKKDIAPSKEKKDSKKINKK